MKRETKHLKKGRYRAGLLEVTVSAPTPEGQSKSCTNARRRRAETSVALAGRGEDKLAGRRRFR
eukprot:CAMPEP_0184393556 /NCGR_PEP_ID=MMETSP0007-20130409/35135_1 /TAXON_ID=97485 /ORGANISM="Prymnesium parvum, Strain Texoma1" /LENGTH=63 /DNA_ID=CAMNT_0026744615 /DNA_START=64 /DNA_END=255 /DNA_ORIENTATION=+